MYIYYIYWCTGLEVSRGWGRWGAARPGVRGGCPREAGRLGAATPGRKKKKKKKFEPVDRRFENG
jgi:hypothetical protein